MAERFRDFTHGFSDFQQEFWRLAAQADELRIDWRSVGGSRSSTELPDLLRDIQRPIHLRIGIVHPERQLARYDPNWATDAKHSIHKWRRFFRQKLGAGKISGELFTYKYKATPSIHGFSLNDTYFFIAYTRQLGHKTLVECDYQRLRWQDDPPEKIDAFRSTFTEPREQQIWPDYKFVAQLESAVSAANNGEIGELERLIDLVIGLRVMQSVSDGASVENVLSEARRTREYLLKNPSAVLRWLTGEKPLTGCQPALNLGPVEAAFSPGTVAASKSPGNLVPAAPDAPKQTRLIIERWSDLAIGISTTPKRGEEFYRFVPGKKGLSQVPGIGDRVLLSQAELLTIPPGWDRLKAVLRLLAKSREGNTAERKDLYLFHGRAKYLRERLDVQLRALRESGAVAVDDDATKTLKAEINELSRSVMREESEHLRKLIPCAKKFPWQCENSPVYRAAFVVQHVVEIDGNLHFGEFDG